jgi:radical SAM superfamily enzyme YgiQ (UPF0313 family)
VLERTGVEVRILDFSVFPYSEAFLEAEMADFSPQMVGVTAVTMTFDHAIRIIEDVKRIDPDVPTVMGGPHVSFRALETLEAFPFLDIIACGEGEEAIVDLAKAAEKRCGWRHIPGIHYRDRLGLHSTGPREGPVDINTLPIPARHLLPLGRYRALRMPISLTTSRGCPFKCIFCVGRKMVGAKVRYRNPLEVVNEMEALGLLGFHQINIADDLFTANKNHCLAVADEILRRNLKLKWTNFARVDTVTREVLCRMKAAGCTTISFGVETGNPDILKTIKKGITLEQVKQAVVLCRDSGIEPHVSFILGLPGESPKTLRDTLTLGDRLKALGACCGFHILAPFPGTEVREESESLGIRILHDNWSQYHANRAVSETSLVSRQTLDDIVIRWEKDYTEYLGDIKRRTPLGEATEEEIEILTNLEKVVLTYDLMMGRILEEKGSWNQGFQAETDLDLLETLVDRVTESVPNSREQVWITLQDAVQRGNLRCRREEGKIRWEWVNFL